MIQYIGGGKHEFRMESGETIILSDRDIINLRIDMQMQAKNHSTQMSELMNQSRSEKPKSLKARKRR